MRRRQYVGYGMVGGLLLGWACGGTIGGTPQPVVADGGMVFDAGDDDGGAGAQDAGQAADGGMDAGMIVHLTVPLPANAPGWTFAGPQMGGPNKVNGASLDEGGNLWVAGGEEGLYVLRAGAATFEHFTMAEGLRPYGYMPDGSTPPGDKYLNVLTVAGAAAGTVFVGYAGKPPAAGEVDCEGNWDGPNPDPAIYKSGDADKVTLSGAGIAVAHYDISSGPGIVGNELRGREKLCNIERIVYDKANNKVWFGANHGFAMGDANYQGTGRCQWETSTVPTPPKMKTDPLSNEYGHFGCNGVLEHVHPAFQGYGSDTTTQCCSLLTGNYYGVAVDPVSHDLWFGGQMRTTRFLYGTNGGNYYAAQSQTEDSQYVANRIDVWPDAVTEPNIPRPADRVDDFVSGAAAMSDGSVWLSSFKNGLAHLGASGAVLARLTTQDGLPTNKLGAVAVDPGDQSVWVGTNYGPGLARLSGGTFTLYGGSVFGEALTNEGVTDIQASGAGASRRMVVSFRGDASHAGAVGIYTGP
jgi:hypothetical protein